MIYVPQFIIWFFLGLSFNFCLPVLLIQFLFLEKKRFPLTRITAFDQNNYILNLLHLSTFHYESVPDWIKSLMGNLCHYLQENFVSEIVILILITNLSLQNHLIVLIKIWINYLKGEFNFWSLFVGGMVWG